MEKQKSNLTLLKSAHKAAFSPQDDSLGKKALCNHIKSLLRIIMEQNNALMFYAGKTKQDQVDGKREIWVRESANAVLLDQGDRARKVVIQEPLDDLKEEPPKERQLTAEEFEMLVQIASVSDGEILATISKDPVEVERVEGKLQGLANLGYLKRMKMSGGFPVYCITDKGRKKLVDEYNDSDPYKGHTQNCIVRRTSLTCNCGFI